MSNATEQALAELAAGQSYFREHFSHASCEIAHLQGVVAGNHALVEDLRKKITSLERQVADASARGRQLRHDLAIHLRWNDLQAAGIEVMGSDVHGFSEATARLAALAKEGMAKIVEAHEWGKKFEAAGKTDGAKE